MAASRRVPAKSGPDHHGSVTVECPWCHRDHVYTLNTFQDNEEMVRKADCLQSGGANLIISVFNRSTTGGGHG